MHPTTSQHNLFTIWKFKTQTPCCWSHKSLANPANPHTISHPLPAPTWVQNYMEIFQRKKN